MHICAVETSLYQVLCVNDSYNEGNDGSRCLTPNF